MGQFEVINTREGKPSLKYTEDGEECHLHSKYAPCREARNFIEARKEEIINSKVIIVYGLGMGYHIKELEKVVHNGQQVFIFEFNSEIVKFARQNINIEKYREKRFRFFIVNDCGQAGRYLSDVLGGFHPSEVCLIIHRPSLMIIPKEFMVIKETLEDWEIKRDTINRFRALMMRNYKANLNLINKFHFFAPRPVENNRFPVAIIAAGPSLDENKYLLPKLKGKVLTIAAGSALHSLQEVDFIPDCTIITDPQPAVLRQIAGLELQIPLFFFLTVSPRVINNYRGKKIVLFQEGFEPARTLADRMNVRTVDTGGSVSTTALDLAIKIGGGPIIFIGLDLAYTDDRSHARGTAHENDLPNLRGRMVRSNVGGLIKTGRNLNIYHKWIERKIKAYPGIKFINATEGGAYIEGTVNKELTEVVNTYRKRIRIREIITENIKQFHSGDLKWIY